MAKSESPHPQRPFSPAGNGLLNEASSDDDFSGRQPLTTSEADYCDYRAAKKSAKKRRRSCHVPLSSDDIPCDEPHVSRAAVIAPRRAENLKATVQWAVEAYFTKSVEFRASVDLGQPWPVLSARLSTWVEDFESLPMTLQEASKLGEADEINGSNLVRVEIVRVARMFLRVTGTLNHYASAQATLIDIPRLTQLSRYLHLLERAMDVLVQEVDSLSQRIETSLVEDNIFTYRIS